MANKTVIVGPRYQQIAADLAAKIVDGHYGVGDKVYARSALASQYGVSAETARRAICVLVDLGIVESTKGSGVVIKSFEKAVEFVKQFSDTQTINQLKENIAKSVARQKQEFDCFYDCLTELLDKTDRLRSLNPFVPFEIKITQGASCLEKTVSDVNFWHHTGATIIAIKRGDGLQMSPGPYACFTMGDVFYFVGDIDCYERVKNFLYPQ